MSQNDDIEKLLRDVNASLSQASTSKPSGTVTPRSGSEVNATSSTKDGLGTLPKALIAAVVCGGLVFTATLFLQWLPLIDNPVSSGLGAGVGAFLTALVLGRRSRK